MSLLDRDLLFVAREEFTNQLMNIDWLMKIVRENKLNVLDLVEISNSYADGYSRFIVKPKLLKHLYSRDGLELCGVECLLFNKDVKNGDEVNSRIGVKCYLHYKVVLEEPPYINVGIWTKSVDWKRPSDFEELPIVTSVMSEFSVDSIVRFVGVVLATMIVINEKGSKYNGFIKF